MDVIKTKIGDVEVLIQSCDEKSETDEGEDLSDALSDIISDALSDTSDSFADDVGIEGLDGGEDLTNGLPDVSVPINNGIVQRRSAAKVSFARPPRKRIKDKVEKVADDAFEKAKRLIFNMAEACGKEMEECDNKPDEFTLDFSLSFSVKSKEWILGFENNAVLKVGMKWKADEC